MQVSTLASVGSSDCERIADAALAQPVLALTSLAYVMASAVVLVWSVRWREPFAALAGGALAAVGFGSVAFHGPQPWWAGPAHDWPIIAVAVVYAGMLVRSRRSRSPWLAAAGVFALALAAYAVGRTGSPLCRPDSLWQYHGAWHVLSALAAALAARALAPQRSGL
ncbi:hypothetical protein E4P42_05130 [Mycobacterium sp. PS03-16]|uniref:hypothetical protein n=1 Tax=Mycobacterium sp. PS03-16 TaxID=2559611 RepID=UPI001072F5BA|nr:hypothetical protein [Mycobacterium sp. PS03-16]TFV60328.1 hypothetical protein E4P42_05130 [Mycobacterium sp. PS03-16]